MAEIEKLQNIQYIELTRDLEYRDFIGRFTTLIQGAIGFLIDDDNMESVIQGLSKEQMGKCFDILDNAIKRGKPAALIAGYLCVLNESDFFRRDPPGMTPVPPSVLI